MNGVEGPMPSHGVRKYFYFIKEEVSSKWKDLAYQLGVESAGYNNIAGRNRDDKSCCMDLLEEWLERNGERATIEVLMEALSKANLQNIVDKLKIEDPGRNMRKRKAQGDDDSPARPYDLRGVRGRPGVRDRETHKLDSADILKLHSKFGLRVEELKPKEGGMTIQGSSIPLILPNDMMYDASTGRVEKVKDAQRTSLQVVYDALALLEGIEEPVSVLAICGPCRTGKSYILSRLLGTADAFELGHRMDPKTFGIWMGTNVLRGKDFTIVLLDTEGIDAVAGSAGQDASILVMTILLSSQLIYNSLNVPHKGDLEKMKCFINLAEAIRVEEGKKTGFSAFRQFFPDFLWLLRDVTLKMEDEDGRQMDPTDYLKTKVLSRDPDAFKESTSDEVGRAILTFFPSVECATLERPSGDTEVMNNIAQHTESLNPRFYKGVENLTERLLKKARVKKGYQTGSTVSGLALSIMAKQYVEAANDPNSIPALDNTWQNTIELMRGKAIEEAVQEYKKQMQTLIAEARLTENKEVPLEDDETLVGNEATEDESNIPKQPTLMGLHNASVKNVTAMLLQKIGHFGIGSEKQGTDESSAVVDQMQNRLVKREQRTVDQVAEDGTRRKVEGLVVTGGELLHFIQQNRELSKSFCQDLFERLLDPIRKQIDSPPKDFGFETLKGELTDARQQYVEQARGPEKWTVLREMTQSTGNLMAEIEKMGYKSELIQAQQKAHDAEVRNKEMERVIHQLQVQVQDMQHTQTENLREMIQMNGIQIKKMQQEMEERFAGELKKVLEFQNAKMEEQAEAARDRMEKEKAMWTEKLQNMKKEQAALVEKLEELEKKKITFPFTFTKDDGSKQCTIM
ncbi:uncharacterized protein LOC144866030 [Branchiostoma floridae x Branchiostoma japonicum]